ncbi:hypothetical protein [Lysobacter enzymogenes]|uniref:hypothetical protein n=1 Tax=Lysobacter enzymogenes TaxID=69 RepID=UPI001AF6963F|nr:hypothetical protein [Lysobacter enzymogenes]QQQ00873.1 hypothetical protein JHW41_22875 [Lysobacter enzymogenes]
MVTPVVVRYDVKYRGVLDWRIYVDGADDPAAFATRAACVAAACNRARERHTRSGSTTEVWAPGLGGEHVCEIRYMKPEALEHLLQLAAPDSNLLGASYAYGPLFPPATR